MSITTRYRVWLRGAFPRVVPQYVDKDFPSLPAACAWAFNKVVKSVQAAGNGPSYTKYEIHTLTANGQTGPCVARWQAGA